MFASDSIGPAPTGFFETIAAVVEAARAESGEDSPKDTGSSAGLGAAVEDVHDEVAEIDVGISVADELSIGNCYVLQNFMEVRASSAYTMWFLCSTFTGVVGPDISTFTGISTSLSSSHADTHWHSFAWKK